MRPRSITGPLIVIAIGMIFLVHNLRPGFSPFALIVNYWPFLLIGAGLVGLVEVLYYASRGGLPPRPMGGGWVFWIVVWAVVAGLLSDRPFRLRLPGLNSADLAGVSILGNDYRYDVPPTAEPDVTSHGVRRILLDNIHGNITVRGADSSSVSITGHKNIRAFSRRAADRASEQAQISLDREGDAIVVRAAGRYRAGPNRIVTTDLDISVPKSLGIEAQGRQGDLSVENIEGGVDLSSGRGGSHLSHIGGDARIKSLRSGDISVDDLRGSLSVEGRGGDIEVSNVTGRVAVSGEFTGTLAFRGIGQALSFESARTEFAAASAPGSISLDLGRLRMINVTGPVRFQTGARDIEATDITNALDLAVNRGDIEITANKTPLPEIEAHTRNGDMTISVPAGAGFDLKATATHGEAENEYGAPILTQSNGRGSASMEGRSGPGARIALTADHGNVSVKKL